MQVFYFLAALIFLGVLPSFSQALEMSGIMTNKIIANGKILDRQIYPDGSGKPYKTSFVYVMAYEHKVYFCTVEDGGSKCFGTETN